MRFTWLAIALSFATVGSAQQVTADGEALFRGNCAFCHGSNAKGGRGPNLLVTSLNHGNEDSDLERVIRNGVKGSSMPDFDFEPEELTALIAYIQSLRKRSAVPPLILGDAKAGNALYAQNGCAACHQVGAAGSVYGPPLTRVGSARSYEYLRESVTNPSADIPDEYKGVTVVTMDGKRYTGVRINEDTFSIQLRLPDQRFRSFSKDSLREVKYLSDSLMPPYRFKDADLQNLLAYLSTLRETPAESKTTPKQQGIH
ncbi:MAG: c-type cytochrome [Bryobacteraceae bacterium]